MPIIYSQGFNFNEKCAVLPSCTSESNPPKYEPITCGEVRSVSLSLSVCVWVCC